ncbi:hypothetical protein HUJ04_003997 [Dendroctonus ponderosae]|nr:hypothetical protein HUJ04_003997 [Dendroctonus ponderosae]
MQVQEKSNPSTPTQPRRPDFIGVVYASTQPGAAYYEFQPSETGASVRSGQPHSHGQYGGSPQRRFMSEGELVRQEQQLSYPRSNNTVDNIRELANSPQRGVYMWKDTSPSGYPSPAQQPDFYRSNPTSPTQQQMYPPQANTRTYHPANRGGVPVYPPSSPQVQRKLGAGTPPTVGDNRRRPMSFVRFIHHQKSNEFLLFTIMLILVKLYGTNCMLLRAATCLHAGALEMSDNVDLSSQTSQCSSHPITHRPSTPDRTSVYDMNYEISV